ncbi:uncharacterized protein LOC131359394 isoform X2 [Hemibagrus wyckioides]|uniref:uncharacterized protein LOC131359394 isoform X2 n=1 Tax=Hemibagrus wyckioides TaxID=337641 RepID=UPI00266CF71D|nr:uncharacterized protein LOC131359394 isoform X2 [Hemibagrus wyckioides]
MDRLPLHFVLLQLCLPMLMRFCLAAFHPQCGAEQLQMMADTVKNTYRIITVPWIRRRTAGILRMVICMSFLWFHKVNPSDCFTATSNSAATTFDLHENLTTSTDYVWLVNNTVVAREDQHHPMVLSSSPRSITFKTCYVNVSYRNVFNGKVINCPPCTNKTSSESASRITGKINAIILIFYYSLVFM